MKTISTDSIYYSVLNMSIKALNKDITTLSPSEILPKHTAQNIAEHEGMG